MNVEVIANLLRDFTARHKLTFIELARRQSTQLELGAVVGVQEHYRSAGYAIQVVNPVPGRFVVKTSTRGVPWKYSHIMAARGTEAVDIHMNLMIRSAHDRGTYCVDVGVAAPGIVPTKKSAARWVCLENEHLKTFAEAKRLVVYPMLLAQFVGIVHEIKPRFLHLPKRTEYGPKGHIPPTLIVLGHFSGTSKLIVDSYEERGFQIHIAQDFDVRVAWARKDSTRSPLYWEDNRE